MKKVVWLIVVLCYITALSATGEEFSTKKKEGIKGKINAAAPPETSNYVHWQKLMKKKPSVPGEAVSYQFLPPRGYWGGGWLRRIR